MIEQPRRGRRGHSAFRTTVPFPFRYYTKRASKTGAEDKVFAEGVVFYNLKRKAASQSWMVKLRRDMFDWFYSDKIAILGYDKAGRDVTEDQEKFE